MQVKRENPTVHGDSYENVRSFVGRLYREDDHLLEYSHTVQCAVTIEIDSTAYRWHYWLLSHQSSQN